MRLSIQAAMVRRKHNDRTPWSMKESRPRKWTASISERCLQFFFHLLFEHHGVHQRTNSQGHRSLLHLLKEGTFAWNLTYRCRQKRVSNLHGIHCFPPLLNGCRAVHFSDHHVKKRSALLNEPKEFFKSIKVTKPCCVHRFGLFDV